MKLNKVKYGEYAYKIQGVGAKAFATKRGAKVKSIAMYNEIFKIGNKAFYNTKSLTSLKFKHPERAPFNHRNGFSSNYEIARKSFAKCGKGNGKYLTVSFLAKKQ